MERYIGTHVVETNGQALVERLKTIPGQRYVCLEEGTQSSWVYEILSPHAEEVIVTTVPESRGPYGDERDERDAYGLMEQLLPFAIKRRVFKEAGAYSTLRELATAHTMIAQGSVRIQNQLKALYRSRGVPVTGKTIYSTKGREQWLSLLPDTSRGAAMTLYAQYDAATEVRKRAEKELVTEAHGRPVSRVLESCPGLGPIRVSQLVPIVVSPNRFRTKRKVWSYCGLGIVMRSSPPWLQTKEGLRGPTAKTTNQRLHSLSLAAGENGGEHGEASSIFAGARDRERPGPPSVFRSPCTRSPRFRGRRATGRASPEDPDSKLKRVVSPVSNRQLDVVEARHVGCAIGRIRGAAFAPI